MEGYAKAAHLMAHHEEFAIFRQFKQLNYLSLLHQQAEIIHLQDSLSHLVQRDATHPERGSYAKSWFSLSHGTDSESRQQWKKLKRLRKKLDRYNDTLHKQSLLASLNPPNQQDLDFLRLWFQRPGMGNFPIRGLDRGAWNTEFEHDLVALQPRLTPDPISSFFARHIFPLFHRLYGQRFKDPESGNLGIGEGIWTYRESKLGMVVDVVVTVVASLLPLISTIVLYLIEERTKGVKLGVVVVFAAAFAFALATMTKARRVEAFAATAAFAAVNVVFLTSTCTSP
ncbi:hypothetical protein QBC41DRAFT_235370 [Cercophora samala]|uniref:DUF6594 domain-containing protein n=1 Tax=Cercophora samala TaxID=330535 RepID=A0AA40D491_9PEZI|nr:hypothetical protein QBC41DRAFT_235370 [Cercophora samala]